MPLGIAAAAVCSPESSCAKADGLTDAETGLADCHTAVWGSV